MNSIKSKIEKIKYIDIILKGGAIVGFILTISSILGFLLSVPTDYGRYFLFFMIIFTLVIFIQILIFYPLIKLLFWLRNRRDDAEKIQYKSRYKF